MHKFNLCFIHFYYATTLTVGKTKPRFCQNLHPKHQFFIRMNNIMRIFNFQILQSEEVLL